VVTAPTAFAIGWPVNLTATKARLLLMACLMKFGALPPAANSDQPTAEERAAVHEKVAAYQSVFNTH
jgi:L-asparaginase